MITRMKKTSMRIGLFTPGARMIMSMADIGHLAPAPPDTRNAPCELRVECLHGAQRRMGQSAAEEVALQGWARAWETWRRHDIRDQTVCPARNTPPQRAMVV